MMFCKGKQCGTYNSQRSDSDGENERWNGIVPLGWFGIDFPQ